MVKFMDKIAQPVEIFQRQLKNRKSGCLDVYEELQSTKVLLYMPTGTPAYQRIQRIQFYNYCTELNPFSSHLNFKCGCL